MPCKSGISSGARDPQARLRGCLTGKVACAPGALREGGREGRGECRAWPAAEPRAHDACAGRQRNHGLGWRLPAGERKPRTARARRKSGRRRARAPVKEKHKKKLLQALLIGLGQRFPKSPARVLMVSHTEDGLASVGVGDSILKI